MMKRLFALLLVLAFAAPLCAQDTQPDQPAEDTEEEVVGVPADYNDYLKKLYPHVDPGGKHDVFNLKNPKGKDERHEYTVAMAQLLIAYLSPELDFGATLSKLFDQYSRGKEANSAVFKTLYSIVLLYYPPGNPNTAEAGKLLREAIELAPDYAYPHFMLAQFEFARLIQIEGVSPRKTLQEIDKALEIRPDFLRVKLLKCEVYFRYQPPRTKEILDMISPLVENNLPDLGDDFEDALLVYSRCNGTDLEKLLKDHLSSGTLSNDQKLVAHELMGRRHVSAERFDEAIEHFEQMTELSSADKTPARILNARKFLAACWDFKARDLKSKTDDPEIKEQYDRCVEKAVELHRSCAELEAEKMPIVLRGEQALQFMDFMIYMVGRHKEAKVWLEGYLDATDLMRTRRNQLENRLTTLIAYLDPSEENTMAIFRNHYERGDLERLAVSLGTTKERIRLQGESFEEEVSLKFFLEVLDSGDRLVDGFAAFLAVDTAKQIGGDWIAKTGDAVLARLEKEDELKSEAQANLHAQLAEALKLLESWTHMEKAVLHSVKMIKAASDELTVRDLTRSIIRNWTDESLAKSLNPPIREATGMDTYTPEDAAEWMTKKLAPGIRKTAEAAEEG